MAVPLDSSHDQPPTTEIRSIFDDFIKEAIRSHDPKYLYDIESTLLQMSRKNGHVYDEYFTQLDASINEIEHSEEQKTCGEAISTLPKKTGKGRKKEFLFALDEACYVKDEEKRRPAGWHPTLWNSSRKTVGIRCQPVPRWIHP